MTPADEELTTLQAADLLKVPHEYLIQLLSEKRIPFHEVGRLHRLRSADVLAFKEQRDKDRRAGLRELSRLTQELGGYDTELK